MNRRAVVAVVIAVALAAVLTVIAVTAAAPGRRVSPAAVEASGARVDLTSFGLNTPHSAATVPYGTLRLWDTRTTWAHLEPTRGVFDWERLDGYVEQARSQHVRVLLVLGSTPAWAATEPTAPGAGWLARGSSSPPRSDADWVAYVDAVLARYRGRIEAYQVWNEAQSPQFWKGTPQGLAHLTQLTAARVAALDPAALVVATPLQPRQAHWQLWSAAYLAALADRGWPVDVFAVHSYQPDALADPDGRFGLMRQVQAVLRAAGAPRHPLWDTEVNYSSPAFGGHPVQGQQAAD
ncbi:MAG: endo-1,4-beta-xylanase [Actinomycetota bacterium]